MKRFFAVACLAAVISLPMNAIWLSPADAATAPKITWLGEWAGGDLVSPRMIDVDGQGNLYVADQAARAVIKYDRYGRVVAVYLRDQANGKGVAVTPDGKTLYVSTLAKNVAIVDAAGGNVTGQLSGATFTMPGEIDLDAEGYVYVADVGQFNIKSFFPNGSFKKTFGGPGKANGQFVSIASLIVDAGTGRVCVASNLFEVPRLQVFNREGIYQGAVLNSLLYGPDNQTAVSLAFDEQVDGRAYVLRGLPVALRVLDRGLTKVLADFGSVSGKLQAPADVVYDPSTGRLFVSDAAGIDVFGIDGATSPVLTNSLPTAPVPVSPVAGTAVAGLTPTLSWNPSTDADNDPLTYRVQVRQGAAVIYAGTTTATSLAVPANLLAENGSYLWSVQADDGQGVTPGAEVAFVVNAVDEPPTAPQAVAPLAGEALGDAGALVWTAATDPDPNDLQLSYRLEVAAEAGFAEPLFSQTVSGTSALLGALEGTAGLQVGSGYFWRVAAVDGKGLSSAPSAAGRFLYEVTLLQITANVADASVYLHGNHGFAGQFVGVAPLELRSLAAGSYAVVVERPGFDPYVTRVNLDEGAAATLVAELRPAHDQSAFAAGTINGAIGLGVAADAAPFVVDFDGDGVLDLLAGDAAGQVSLFPGLTVQADDNLSVQPRQVLPLPVLPGAVPFVADWNNDGRQDLLVGLADGAVKLFANVGTATTPLFAAGQDLAAGGSALNVASGAVPAVVDLDGDGDKDLVVANAAGRVALFVNQGSDAAPQLAAGVELFQAAAAAHVTPVDWDADGDRDLLVTSGGTVAFYRNDLATADGFVAAGALPVTGAFGVVAVDLDAAAGKDLIVGQPGGRVLFQASTAELYADTCLAFLLARWDDEIVPQVVTENPAAQSQAATVRALLVAGDYAAAAAGDADLAALLAAGGEARTAVEAFAQLLQ